MRLAFRLKNSVLGFVLLIALGAPVGALAQLPEGKGRDTVVKVCGGCHDASQAAALRMNREGWQDLIANMKSLGAEATDAEFAEVLDYLSTNFPAAASDAPQQLNINTATQVELESVAGLLRREATAVRQYVEKTPCKALTDLKKVPGLDYKKIEDRKDLLVCGPPKKS